MLELLGMGNLMSVIIILILMLIDPRLKRGHEFEMEFLRGHENEHFHALGMIMRFSC